MKTILRALSTATPDLYLTQQEVLSVLEQHFPMEPEERELYRRILTGDSIRGRYFGMDSTREAAVEDQDGLVERFRKHGLDLATRAARNAMEAGGVAPGDVGGLVVNTCTGYLCPGFSSYVAETLGLNAMIRVSDLMGMGCGAAIPNLEAAAGMLAFRAGHPVLSIAVEICSATLFMGPEPDLIVSNSIFGDGAAAALVERTNGANGPRLLRIVDFESGLFPKYRRHLHYRTERHRLRNVLDRRVPVIGARTTRLVVERLLARCDLKKDDIAWWVVHPGGRTVLERIQEEFGLKREALGYSHEVLEHYGNMSSPSVLFVLRKILDSGRTRPGEKGVLVSFGAGFSAFAALVEF